jgi:hypothetical protein
MKPFLHGKKTVAFTSLRPAPGMTVTAASASLEGAAASPHAHAHVPKGAPTVEAVKEGDKVVRLIVTCTCGERIEVQCLYPTVK